MQQDSLEKLQELLRGIFQFDCADLDFGIYRILNCKREWIERFLTKDLPETVRAELDKGAIAEQTKAAEELAMLRNRIREDLGDYAIDAQGNLTEDGRKSPIGQKYLEAQTKAAGAKPRPALEAAIFSHLYNFFSRYYDNGDFISKHRSSSRAKYVIPYNGEEIYFYWANSDQYYIKTVEHFRDYNFRVGGITVHFKLRNAEVERDNVKGDKRLFIPLPKDACFDAKEKQIVIPFEYRPLTDQEEIAYGKKNQQDKIIQQALKDIPERFKRKKAALSALLAERRKASDGTPVSYLEHHLRRYTRKNTSDFFIHKDLKGFLERELDFYLKNEVLNLDDLEAAGEARAEGWFQIMKVIRAIGLKVITFLAQIENFQKKMWEKKKFVTETHYCITVGSIPPEFHDQIATSDAQWEEWKELFHIDEAETTLFTPRGKKKRRMEFLKTHPTLVLDTKHFDEDFKDALLASFENLDDQVDGLLLHGENFQALNLLLETYRGNVKCVYIDPPYNTGTGDFLYKDDYQHSSWMTMMEQRISAARSLLTQDGHFICHIDEHEVNALEELIRIVFRRNNSIGPIIWDKRNPKGDATGIATQHEYLLWAVANRDSLKTKGGVVHRKKTNAEIILAKADQLVRKVGRVDHRVREDFKKWLRGQPFTEGEKAYSEIDDEGNVYRLVSMAWPNKKKAPDDYFKPIIHPLTKKPCPVPKRGWRYPSRTLQQLIARGLVEFGPDETTIPNRKYFLKDSLTENVPSLLYYGGSDDILQANMGFFFENPKPVAIGEYVIGISASNDGDTVLDFFAGSGTTAHAVINLNREDGGRRRFILVEMADYFDTVMLPRIKKVIFTPEWKDGKPKRMATDEEAKRSPRIIKYIRIESYEDALNNISFTERKGQTLLRFDDYLLEYMLDWETADSETLLSVEKLSSPFNYKLVLTEGEETREKLVDLAETFNYLLGLRVKSRRVYYDKDRRYLVYRGTVNHNEVVVIWRETKGWKKKDLQRDKKFVAEQKLTEGADEVFVNGDSFIPNAKVLDAVFKRRMSGGV